MKRRIEKMNPRKTDEWKGKILKIWDEITRETLENYFESLPRRLQMCIDANGATIKKMFFFMSLINKLLFDLNLTVSIYIEYIRSNIQKSFSGFQCAIL